MHKERFLNLIRVLSEVPPPKFNIRHWYASETHLLTGQSCGFSACAIGHYIMANPDCGLELEQFGDFLAPVLSVGAKTLYVYEAIAYHFQISEEQAIFLFGPDQYAQEITDQQNITPQDVINRIYAHLRDLELEPVS